MSKDYSDIHFQDDGRLKLLVIVGTRPEIIRLSEVIKKCRRHFDCLLAHTGQNYDYTLNGIFFRDLSLDDPDVYLDAVGSDLGETVGNIIASSYKLIGAGEARCPAHPGRHKLVPVCYFGKAPAHPHLPHGGGQPLQGRVPARGDQPSYRGRYQRREPCLLRACAPLLEGHRLRSASAPT